jgi:YbgC/YbaW family acyl-CoA thioester hydrolase
MSHFRKQTEWSLFKGEQNMINEQALPKELETTATVRFQDCDPFRHLNNARYIDYFMDAREDQLAQFYDFRIFEVVQQTNQAWVVSKTQIAYLAPAAMMEQVLIRTRLIRLTDTVLVVEGMMLDSAGRRLKAVSWIEFTFISLQTGRPAPHPEAFMMRFQPVIVEDVYTADGFNSHVEALKAQTRKQSNPAA